jgi:endonuclease/exonuclease/phosphatase family metal-dependent hydrolase
MIVKGVFFLILSYNIFCPIIGGGENTVFRLFNLTNNIKEYNVILLQESFSICLFGWRFTGIRNLLISLLKNTGFKYIAQDKAPIWGQDSGLLIASKYEISNIKYYKYDAWSGREAWTWKGILSCDINNVTFINTHLQANGFTANGKQLIELRKYINKNYQNKENIIITGDFNNNYFNYEEKKRLYDNLNQFRDLFIGFSQTTVKNDKLERLDYIFLKNNNNLVLNYTGIIDYGISDHCGVYAGLYYN